jgi:hypothetical protein
MRLPLIIRIIQKLRIKQDLREIKRELEEKNEVTIGRKHQKNLCAPVFISGEQLRLRRDSDQEFTIRQLSRNAVNEIEKIFRTLDDFIKIELGENYSQDQIENALCFSRENQEIKLPENFSTSILNLKKHYLKLNETKDRFEFCEEEDPDKLLSVKLCKENESQYFLKIVAVAPSELKLNLRLSTQPVEGQNIENIRDQVYEVRLNPKFNIKIYNSLAELHCEINSEALT